ncbi:hypothetical protein Trydic_g17422 [Trypoxylus dichotomus]
MGINNELLEAVKCWVIIFHKNGIIQDYTMQKKDARKLYNQLKTDKDTTFESILAGINIYKYVQNTKKPIIQFDQSQLNELLESYQLKQRVQKRSKTKNPKKSEEHTCSICLISFSSQTTLRNHQNNDKQHYYRCLYFSKSNALVTVSQDIFIGINTKGSRTAREVLPINSGMETTSHISIRNVSKNLYQLDTITEINSYINDIAIVTENLPVLLMPNTEINLEIVACIPEALTTLFINVFSFTNKTKRTHLNLVKEITLQVTGESYKDLLPTSQYVKQVTKRNDIDVHDYVGLGGPTPVFKYAMELSKYSVPKALETLLENDLQPFKNITSGEYKYLQNIQGILKENESGQYLTRNNYFHLLDLLIHMEEYQLSIDIRNYDTQTKDLIKIKGYNDRYQLMVPELAERRPSLLPGDSVFVKAAKTKTYQGVVRAINQDTVILEFNRQFSKSIYTTGIKLDITYGYNRQIIRYEHRSVHLLSAHRVLAPFFPTKIHSPSVPEYKLKWFNNKIESNREQQQAIVHILSRSSYPAPYLIFGPPGTGKTMTIVEAISQVWKTKPSSNILVCAPSNSVANEIALRLTEYVPKSELFRYMSVSFDMYNIPDKVLPFTNYDDGDFYTPTPAEIRGYRIVISTLTNAAKLVSIGVPQRHFSYVFIDESGHATETETLIAIAGLVTSEESAGTVLAQIVLAGDPQQLGPIIHSPYAKHYGYGTSMLERLMTTIELYKKNPDGKYNPMVLTKLLNNYRSHPSILHLPNTLFYEKELIAKGDDLVNIALNWERLPNKKFPIIFHSVQGADQREANSPSYFNVQEIEVVMNYLNDLIGHRLKGRKITQEDIGVIAPYRKQVQKIRKACEKKNWTGITIGSVEQFQGQERLIIIISTVRSQPKLLKFDNKFHLGFLNNPKRFNVSITRAKALVIVVGNPNLLQYEAYWKKFIHFCEQNKCMTGSSFEFSPKAVDSLALDMAKLRIDGQPDDVADFSRGNI